ncbi:MAG: hypothetical protein JW990_11575 [Thermoleophilia bacterium]|nr:hypothetical protein [Thermoleophilia bacterium]
MLAPDDGSLRLAADVTRIDRQLGIDRLKLVLMKWVAIPVLGLGVVMLFRVILELGALLDIRTLGVAVCWALAYGGWRTERRRLLDEIEDLEEERSAVGES